MASERDDETVQTHTPASGGDRKRPSRPTLPPMLGRYKVIRLLGQGGVGAVYEAEDPEVGRRVAIKVLREDRDGDAEALRGEAQALGRLVHPHVLAVYDVGVVDGDVFLVMQLVEGETLDRWVESRSVSADKILAMFIQAGEGLAAAHAAGLVHCDFKPSNILVDRLGVVRVSDFGLARATRAAHAHDAIASASMISISGTPAYMAPEQFDGKATPATDQFAFCVSLWEVLAGERPFEDSSIHVEDIIAARGPRRELPRSSNIAPHVKLVLEKGLAADPADRFPSMDALLAALRERPRSRRMLVVAIAGTVAAGGAVAAYLATRESGPPAPPEPWGGADLAGKRTLTKGKGCDDSPVIDASGVVVFGRTFGDEVDLYSVPLGGGEAKQLTKAATWEWRPNRGRKPGEILHLVHDAKTSEGATLSYLDLATGKQTVAAGVYAWDAVMAGTTLAYSPDEPGGIRKIVEHKDLPFLDPPRTHSYFALAATATGDRLATTETTQNGGPTRPCVVDSATSVVTCIPTRSADGRPAFGADGTAIYFAGADGIVRRDLATGDETTIVPGVWAEGGVAVAPDGSALVYSLCGDRRSVVDVTAKPPATVVPGPSASEALPRGDGMLVWIRDVTGIATLVGRTKDGRELQLTDVAWGSVHTPKFSPDGTKLVFASAEPHPGIFTLRLSTPGAPHQVTNDGSDQFPVWTPSGAIAFTRGDGTTNHVFVVSAEGGPPKQLLDATRTVYGNRGNELLVDTGEDETTSLRWLDVTTGAERVGPARPRGYIKALATSPSGAWIAIAIGFNGQDIWRISADPPGEPEHVLAYNPNVTVAAIGVTDDGRVLATQQAWEDGPLELIPARSGARF